MQESSWGERTVEVFFEALSFILLGIVIYFYFRNREWQIKFEQRIKEFLEKEEEKISIVYNDKFIGHIFELVNFVYKHILYTIYYIPAY